MRRVRGRMSIERKKGSTKKNNQLREIDKYDNVKIWKRESESSGHGIPLNGNVY